MAVLALALAAVVPAQAQFRIGPRVGVAVNKFSFNKELLNSDNRAGFTGGLMVEFTVPIVGIGLDASVMYARRSLSHTVTALDNEGIADGNTTISKHLDYIDIPVNLKYKLGLPVLSKIVKPYFTTGPDFAFLVSGKNIYKNFILKGRSCDISWNFGFGLELLNHLQVGANYGFGINKAIKNTGIASNVQPIEGKSRCWTITAAYLF